MGKENLIKVINKYFKDKVLKYTGPILYNVDMPADIDYKVEVLRTRKMISVGEWYDFLFLKIIIVGVNNKISELVFGLSSEPELKFIKYDKDGFYFLRVNILSYLYDIIRYIDNDVRLTIDEIVVDVPKKEQITEEKMSKIAIRTIVKDIVEVLKKTKKSIEKTLPERQEEYQFTNLPFSFRVELYLKPNKSITKFNTNAFYVGDEDEDVIELGIEFNPNTLRENFYDLIGELNEIIAHELEHGLQNYYGEYDSDEDFEEIKDPFEYHTLPHEIPAQVAGFQRLAKLKKEPFEKITKQWFDTHEDIHGLNPEQKEQVIKRLIKYYEDKKSGIMN